MFVGLLKLYQIETSDEKTDGSWKSPWLLKIVKTNFLHNKIKWYRRSLATVGEFPAENKYYDFIVDRASREKRWSKHRNYCRTIKFAERTVNKDRLDHVQRDELGKRGKKSWSDSAVKETGCLNDISPNWCIWHMAPHCINSSLWWKLGTKPLLRKEVHGQSKGDVEQVKESEPEGEEITAIKHKGMEIAEWSWRLFSKQ